MWSNKNGVVHYTLPKVEVSTRGRVRVDGRVRKASKHGKQMRTMIRGKYFDVASLLKHTCGVPACPSGVWSGPVEWEVWLPVAQSAYRD